MQTSLNEREKIAVKKSQYCHCCWCIWLQKVDLATFNLFELNANWRNLDGEMSKWNAFKVLTCNEMLIACKSYYLFYDWLQKLNILKVHKIPVLSRQFDLFFCKLRILNANKFQRISDESSLKIARGTTVTLWSRSLQFSCYVG